MPDILISEQIRGAAVDALAARFEVSIMPDLWRDPRALVDQIADVRALIIRNQTQVTLSCCAVQRGLSFSGGPASDWTT